MTHLYEKPVSRPADLRTMPIAARIPEPSSKKVDGSGTVDGGVVAEVQVPGGRISRGGLRGDRRRVALISNLYRPTEKER